MELLWVSVLIPLVFAQTEFGTSYLKNSRLCSQWSCLNEHLGLTDSLPPREQYTRILQGLLPSGPWQDAVGSVLDACYGDRPRRYTNTCPGQALLHCAVDQLIENCPSEHWITKDACAPVTSLAGFRYMFSQSRYNDLEKNLPSDRRPAWFLRNYFNAKCCDLPSIFNDTLLNQCGFHSIIYYYQQQTRTHAPTHTFKVERKQSDNGEVAQVAPFDDVPTTPNIEQYGEYDPLDCCDMHEFISPSWRSDCDFQLKWDSETRLSIKNSTRIISTTTTEATRTLKAKDVKMVPNSCEQNNCVFRALNIISDSGNVDIDAFSKLLNNLTDMHPAWIKAKGRVFTKCLSKPIRDYDYDCHINKVLGCTFDVLSENCPNSKTPDVCRHSGTTQNEVICQISSSKYRPKNRRLFCGIPSLVKYEVLDQCYLKSLINLEYVPETVFKPRSISSSVPSMCKDSTPSTICIMDKMGVLNKYNFMDYFKMKERIRSFSYGEWYPFSNAFSAVFQSVPLYKEYCSSPKKLLNVVDSMLMPKEAHVCLWFDYEWATESMMIDGRRWIGFTHQNQFYHVAHESFVKYIFSEELSLNKTCPFSKRRNTPQCNKLFSDLTNVFTKKSPQSEQMIKLFGHVFITNQHLDIALIRPNTLHNIRVETNPIYDFGMFNSGDAPSVRTIDVKPKTYKPPLVLLPVYQKMPFKLYNKENIMRSVL